MRRWILFAIAMASLILLTFAGVLLAFSIEVTSEMTAAAPDAPVGSRAIVVPIADPASVATAASNKTPATLVTGQQDGSFPTSATGTRMGAAIAYVPEHANSTITVDNRTIDLAAMSNGTEGWILRGANESAPWFAAKNMTIGQVARYETTSDLVVMFVAGGLGFVVPLVVIMVTHRGSGRAVKGPSGDAFAVCRECRAPMPANAEFCMRCGAYRVPREEKPS